MRQSMNQQRAFFALVSILVIIIDAITKAVAFASLSGRQPIEIFPRISLRLALNQGLPGGMGVSNQLLVLLLGYAVYGAAIFFAIRFAWKNPHTRLAVIAAGLVAGGAAGNSLDRIFRAGVVDFIAFHVKGYSYLVVNCADLFIWLASTLCALAIARWYAERQSIRR